MTTSPAAGIFLAGTSRYAVAGQTILALLITMAKIDERDPRAHLADVLEQSFLVKPKSNQLHNLFPWKRKAAPRAQRTGRS